jgi:hypothetical protein
MQNLPFSSRAANDVVRRILKSFKFVTAVEQQILGERQLAQGKIQTRRFLATAALRSERLALDNQQINIGIGPRVATGSGTEQNHGVRIGFANYRIDHLLNEALVIALHLRFLHYMRHLVSSDFWEK